MARPDYTIPDLDALTDVQVKGFENRVRRACARLGYRLKKHGVHDPRALLYGRYALFELVAGKVRCVLEGATLLEVAVHLGFRSDPAHGERD